MMSNAFNSSTEIALRILLLLYATEESFPIDEIVLLDFITIYAKDFGISSFNLHGLNRNKESEFAARRQQTKEAIRYLVINDYIDVEEAEEGFLYSINQKGSNICDKLESQYAADYSAIAIKVAEYAKHHDCEALLSTINRKALDIQEEGNK